MLIADQLIYFELHKTGCTHTRRILLNTLPNSQTVGMHNSVEEVDSRLLKNFDSKVKIGNIRNPWDWYVSLWAFGCMQRGGMRQSIQNMRKQLQQRTNNEENRLKKAALNLKLKPLIRKYDQLDALYSDSHNKANFRSWLKHVIGLESTLDIGEGYKNAQVSKSLGLLSFRYLNLYVYKGAQLGKTTSHFNKIQAHDSQHNFIDVFIRNESLHEDLLTNANMMSIEKKELESTLRKFSAKTNTSKRESDYRAYYDAKTADLVANYDRLIIEKHQYSFD